MRIWKVTLRAEDIQNFAMPRGAKPLTVQVQGGEPQLWFQVDEKEPMIERRTFATYGTGNPIPNEPGNYIGTYQVQQGLLVFHVYEVTACTS